MPKAILLLLFIGLCSCASHNAPSVTTDFLSESLSHPKKAGTAEIPSRYWAHGNLLIHFITNANEQNKNQSPIIYVHGLAGSLDGFLDMIKIMHPTRSSRPYYAIDLPPFGRSVLKEPKVSIREYTEMLQEFISMLGVPKVSLVCHSMGGQVCIGYALSDPNQIQLLTLISPAGVYDKTAFITGVTHHFANINVGSVDYPNATTVGDMPWYNQDFTRRMITNDPMILVGVESFRENFRTRIHNLKTKTLIL